MAETLADPMLGRLIDARYEVRERVASGGMATVYLAFDRRLERSVAIKVMHTGLSIESDRHDFSSRFRREAKAAARLTHPGMVRVYDQGVDGDVSYLTMEYVDGENLRHRLAHEATLPVGEALGIVEAVLDALAAAHRQGLVHRDVKPENVLMDPDGRPKLADFGLARAVTEVTSTSTGTIMGTVAYLGPELVSRGQSDARTDVYACGILLYEMVTGRQPFTAPSAVEVASRHVHEDVPAPSVHVPWLPAEFDALVLTMTARDPDARPADAGAAMARVRQTRAMMDDPTLDRRADPPSGALPVIPDDAATTVFAAVPAGATVALPIGLGEPLADLRTHDVEIIEDDPDALPPSARSNRWGLWTGAIVAALLLMFGLGTWWYTTQGPGAYTTVPPVAGFSAANARAILEAEGLDVTLVNEFSYDVAAGVALRTEPGAQERVPNGENVRLIVSKGPKMGEVPVTVGVLEGDALAALDEAGFEVGEVTREHSDTAPEGEVTASSPAGGETVRLDTPINLTISLGPQPIVIPDVIGFPEQNAIDTLEKNFALDVSVVRQRTLEQDKGLVFKTDPEPNADGFRAQAITIYVSDGPPLVTVPDVTGEKINDAKAKLEGLGLVVEEHRVPFSVRHEVYSQNPSGGTEVEYGSTVVLYY